MNYELRTQINMLAEDIQKLFAIQTPVEDMAKVVEILGGRLVESGEMGCFSEGTIEKADAGEGFLLTIPRGLSENRKNLATAHSLGHLFLHRGYLIDAELWKKQEHVMDQWKGNFEQEWQTNEFAAAFLMPRKKYKEILDKYSEDNYVLISKVADYFRVPIDAAVYRGKWRGYFQ